MRPTAIADSTRFRVRFGAGDAPDLAVATPVLAGEGVESQFPHARPAGRSGAFELFRDGAWLLGRASLPGGDGLLEPAAYRLYGDLFEAVRDHALARVWNYVPAINGVLAGGLENYRAFCRGRSRAFEDRFGPAFRHHAPAASAVGCDGSDLLIAFAAHAGAASHVENPRQVPAYDYPADYGPCAPTFARASVVHLDGDCRAVFISGTAAIQGHASVAPGETLPQLACTIENLREISRACGLGEDLGGDRAAVRHFRVYLRDAADLAAVRAGFDGVFVRPGDRITYLRSDICRRELKVEIEVSLPHVRQG